MPESDLSRRDFVKGVAVGAAGAALGMGRDAAAGAGKDGKKVLNYDERMEYRRCGKTELMVSAIGLGGHWKRLGKEGAAFEKNRWDVVSKCIDSGINYVDACEWNEILAYAKALKGRREKMYFGFSWCVEEMRNPKFRTKKALLATLEKGMKQAGLDYVDLWRVSCIMPGQRHTFGEVFEMADAADKAVKDGKCRHFGISTHDARFLESMIRSLPVISAVLIPYTARSKAKPTGSLFETVRKCDVGFFGIKPFASNAIFKGSGQPGNPHEQADNERARMAIRHILCNDAITAPIPGLISAAQVDNCLQAIAERRKLDEGKATPGICRDERFARLAEEMSDRLPADYEWLKEWDWV